MISFRIAFVFLASTTVSFAADWTSYSNPRFGWSIDIPQKFVPDSSQGTAGNSLDLTSLDAKAKIQVWGHVILMGSFGSDAYGQLRSNKIGLGWKILDEENVEANLRKNSPITALEFYGESNDQMMFEKSIPGCRRNHALHLHVEFPKAEFEMYRLMISKMAESFKSGHGTVCS